MCKSVDLETHPPQLLEVSNSSGVLDPMISILYLLDLRV